MPDSNINPGSQPSSGSEFATTDWSAVLAAGEDGSPRAKEALERLCRAYWYPLYAYVRRVGHSAADAQDLTQEFFARLLEKNYFALAKRERGRFRTFLLTGLKHFLINEWKRNQARKPDDPVMSLGGAAAEECYTLEPVTDLTPERIYERRWALTLLDRTLDRLRAEYVDSGKGELFDQLKDHLSGEKSEDTYADIAARLNMTEAVVNKTVQRMRERLGQLLRAEIGRTVTTASEVEEELRYMKQVLSR